MSGDMSIGGPAQPAVPIEIPQYKLSRDGYQIAGLISIVAALAIVGTWGIICFKTDQLTGHIPLKTIIAISSSFGATSAFALLMFRISSVKRTQLEEAAEQMKKAAAEAHKISKPDPLR